MQAPGWRGALGRGAGQGESPRWSEGRPAPPRKKNSHGQRLRDACRASGDPHDGWPRQVLRHGRPHQRLVPVRERRQLRERDVLELVRVLAVRRRRLLSLGGHYASRYFRGDFAAAAGAKRYEVICDL